MYRGNVETPAWRLYNMDEPTPWFEIPIADTYRGIISRQRIMATLGNGPSFDTAQKKRRVC